MRALILVAGAALAVSACSSNDNANNTMNVDENLSTTDLNATTDMNAATDMNATDLNVSAANVTVVENGGAAANTTANATTNATTNNAM
jgi:hypothetical protein